MKKIFQLALIVAVGMSHAYAKVSECRLTDTLKVTGFSYTLLVSKDENGNEYLTPMYNPDGTPLLNPDGSPKYRLANPLTIIYTIKGTYQIKHKDGTTEGPRDFSKELTGVFPQIVPPESISADQAEKLGETVIEQARQGIKEALCNLNKCNEQ